MALFPFPRYYRVRNTRYCDNTAYFVPISALFTRLLRNTVPCHSFGSCLTSLKKLYNRSMQLILPRENAGFLATITHMPTH